MHMIPMCLLNPSMADPMALRWPIPSFPSRRSRTAVRAAHVKVMEWFLAVVSGFRHVPKKSHGEYCFSCGFFPWYLTYNFWDGIRKLKSLKWSMMLFHWEYGGFSTYSMWFNRGLEWLYHSQVTLSQFHASTWSPVWERRKSSGASKNRRCPESLPSWKLTYTVDASEIRLSSWAW